MKQVLTLITLMLFSVPALAQEIANCRSPKGKAFYFNLGIVQKNNAGWGDDAISGGVFTLSKKGGEFDILYLDSSKRIVSSKSSGAVIQPLRKGVNRYRFPRHEPASRKTAFRTVPEKGHCCGHDAG